MLSSKEWRARDADDRSTSGLATRDARRRALGLPVGELKIEFTS